MKYKYFFQKQCQAYFGICVLCLFVTIIFSNASCRKMVTTEAPVTSLTGENVYKSDQTAAAVLNGIYGSMGNGNVFSGLSGISLLCGLSADELILYNGGFDGGILQNSYQNTFSGLDVPYYWRFYYTQILTLNSALEGLNESTSLTPSVKKQLIGEAKFLRAFYYFYLTNFYGDVPLNLTSDWRINALSSRIPKEDVYRQIIIDLKEAQELLNERYLKSDALTIYPSGTEERVRPTKWASTALLARVYLYNGEWAKAEDETTKLIENHELFSLSALSHAFNKNNPEAIWQIQYVNTDWNTEGYHFILTENPSYTRPTYLSPFLFNAFESGDNRKVEWTNRFVDETDTFYFPFKYKLQNDPNSSEYFMVLRLAEQYLIRAEARVHLTKLGDAVQDLNVIRNRAGLTEYNGATDETTIQNAIIHERQVELFAEWGHRWFDLKRTALIDGVMNTVYPTKQPGGVWNSYWQLYPLSTEDLRLNPRLAPNNPGY